MTLPSNWKDNTAPLLDVRGKGVQLKTLKPKHEYIMDLMLARPTESYGSLARFAGVTPSWFSTVVNSDIFQERLRQRRALLNQEYTERMTSKLGTLAEKGVDAMLDCMDDDEVSYKEKHSVARTALEAAGIIGKSASINVTNNSNVQNNHNTEVSVHAVSIEAARDRIRLRDERMVREAQDAEEKARLANLQE